MANEDLYQSLLNLIDPFIMSGGMNLVEMQLSGGRQRQTLRLFVDKPGGITIDDCATLSRSLADLLDTHDPIRSSYVLQISSPGLTRDLKTHRDFAWAAGKRVRMILDGGAERVGTLELNDDGSLVVADNDSRHTVQVADVRKANLQFE